MKLCWHFAGYLGQTVLHGYLPSRLHLEGHVGAAGEHDDGTPYVGRIAERLVSFKGTRRQRSVYVPFAVVSHKYEGQSLGLFASLEEAKTAIEELLSAADAVFRLTGKRTG